MQKYNADNERVKRKYLVFLKEAKRQDETSIDAVAKALSRFESYTKYKNFKAFHFAQAVGFKKFLANQMNQISEKPLSKATQNSSLRHLKAFFQWLAMQTGYKSRINYTETEYFNLSEKDTRVATARRSKPVPTIEQIKYVITKMADTTDIERRNRALIAFFLLTGARDSAVASLSLKHVNLAEDCLFQDARDVKTKFSKTFTTYFFPVGEEVRQIVVDWIDHLRDELLYGHDDPLFPKTNVVQGKDRTFEPSGFKREHWATATPIRTIFKRAFESANLPYFNPHSFRKTLVIMGEQLCQTPEEFKAWSQNLGHEGVLTTLYSYGEVQPQRQASIIRDLKYPIRKTDIDEERIADALFRRLSAKKLSEPKAF